MVSQQRLPKDLLQESIRPILINLAAYNKLTVPLLNGLSDLLELLSTWFNVTLGNKLKDHLTKWLDPDTLLSEPRLWKPGEEAAIAAGQLLERYILSCFYFFRITIEVSGGLIGPHISFDTLPYPFNTCTFQLQELLAFSINFLLLLPSSFQNLFHW